MALTSAEIAQRQHDAFVERHGGEPGEIYPYRPPPRKPKATPSTSSVSAPAPTTSTATPTSQSRQVLSRYKTTVRAPDVMHPAIRASVTEGDYYDLNAIARKGDPKELEAAKELFGSEAVTKAQQSARKTRQHELRVEHLSAFRNTDGTYKLVDIASKGTEQQRASARILFSPGSMEKAADTARILSQLKPYSNPDDSYDIGRLIDKGTDAEKAAARQMWPGIVLYKIPEQVSSKVHRRLGPEAQKYTTPKLSFWEKLTPWQEELGERATAGNVAVMAAEVAIPGAYLARHWGTLKPWEKGVGIAVDVGSLIPGVAFASALRRATVPTVKALGKTVIAEVKAPITTVLHPVESAKSLIYPVESMVRPRALPITAVEIRSSTVKIPVGQIGSRRDAMAARDALVSEAVRGPGATVEVGGQRLALTPTALQDVVQGAAVHNTPDVRPFMGGVTVAEGRQGGLFMSPTLHTRFTVATAFGEMPKGGLPGAVIITDKKLLSRLQPSGKVYRGQVEIEKILRAGERIPAPSQVLMTRTASGHKLALLIVGPKLSPAQIARLKVMGAKDVIRDIFAPAWKGTAVKDMDELVELGKKAKGLEDDIRKALAVSTPERVRVLEAELRQVNAEATRLARQVDRAVMSRTPMRPVGLGYGRLLEERLFDEYARTDPAGFARVVRRMNADGQRRVFAGLEPRLARNIRIRVSRLPVTVDVPRVYRPPIVPGVGRVYDPVRERPPGREEPPSRVTPPPGRIPPPDIPPPPDVPPPPPRVPPLSTKEEGKGRKRVPMGSITWKQGLFWITLKPPYRGRADMIWTLHPPAGAKVVRGAGSAQKTITKLGVNVPGGARLDLGIFDITISKHGRRIRYKRDIKQRTRLGYPTGMPAGVVGLRER